MEQNTASAKKKFPTMLSNILDYLEAGIITIFVFLLIFAYLIRTVAVDGSSMFPTLHHQDQMLVLSTFSTPKPGSIVLVDDREGAVFSDPMQTVLTKTEGLDIIIVKRLIAVGGQEVDIDFETGKVSVDGTQLEEPYIAEPTSRNDGAFHYPLTVPEGYLFVMGDNRQHSTDSRSPQVGLVPEDQLMGVAVLRYSRSGEGSFFSRFAVL